VNGSENLRFSETPSEKGKRPFLLVRYPRLPAGRFGPAKKMNKKKIMLVVDDG